MTSISIAIVLVALIASYAFKQHLAHKERSLDEKLEKRINEMDAELKSIKTQITLRRF